MKRMKHHRRTSELKAMKNGGKEGGKSESVEEELSGWQDDKD